MSRSYVLTKRAQRDLKGIRDYIAGDSPRAAARFVASLIEEFERIADFPLMAQAVASHPRFRRLPHGAYVIFYEILGEKVVIRSVEHSATLK